MTVPFSGRRGRSPDGRLSSVPGILAARGRLVDRPGAESVSLRGVAALTGV
jgi:hypothetical protein